MMRFSRNKDGKKDKEKKLTRKEKKQRKEKQVEAKFVPLFTTNDWDLKEVLESHGFNLKPNESSTRTSRLVPTLEEILSSPLALPYFLEFLETKDLKHLVDFWLAVQAFKVVAIERCRLNSNDAVKRKQEDKKQELVGNLIEREVCSWSVKGEASSGGKTAGVSNDQKRSDFSRQIGETTHQSTENHVDQSNGDNCLVGNHNFHEQSRNTYKKATKSEDLLTGINFSGNWEPFSNEQGGVPGRFCTGDEEQAKMDSYVARRIMSRQTRNRTRTTVIDAVDLYARFVSLDADHPLGFPSDIRNQIEAEICRDKDNVSADCFVEAQDHVIIVLKPLYDEFIGSPFGNKYKLYLLRETKPRLQDILYNETSLFYFMEYLDRENGREILEFWLMAENFEQTMQQKQASKTYDISEAVDDAMSIYEKYFSMRAKHQIIKDDKLRILIENNICREDGPQPNCFCIPVAFAWTVLKEIFFERFLVSDHYSQLLDSVCKNSIDRPKNDEVSSTTSSDSRSESTEFLPTSASMSDFLDQDADSLWYRPDAGRLAMGYVNPLGVFVTELDSPEDVDDKSSVSKLGKAMKNLLSKESEEEKERLAWEKARKIVEDIQRQSNRR